MDRACLQAISWADSPANSNGRSQRLHALVPSPTPFCMQRLEHPRVSRSRPRNDETEGVSGKLGGPLNSNGVGSEGTLICRVLMKEGS